MEKEFSIHSRPFMPFFPSKLKATFCQVYMTLNANVFKALSKIKLVKSKQT